jgi:threonine/homoserine/homoserine lactone efflux protein
MGYFQNFVLAFVFSFTGSIPPGTINLTILQVGIERKLNVALRFALAAALMEYPYAWLAVAFESYITSSPVIVDNFKLIGSMVMLVMGALNLLSARKPTAFLNKLQGSGFRRGIMLGILNPMAIPYWIAMTAYMRLQGWIKFSNPYHLHAYLLGVSMGAFVILMIIAHLAQRMITAYKPGSFVKFIPGAVLVILGLYTFIQYLF